MTYKLVTGANAVLAFAHIFWTLLGTVTVLPAFYDVEFVLKLNQPDLNEGQACLLTLTSVTVTLLRPKNT